MSLVQQRLRQQRMEKDQLKRDFAKVKQLTADGKAKEAREILAHVIETTKNEKAKGFAQAWLDRLTLPKPGRFANYQRVVKWGAAIALVVMVVVILACGVILSTRLRAINEDIKDFLMGLAVERVCIDVFIDVAVDYDIPAEDFVDACEEEADHIMALYAAEVEYCYDRTQNANLERQFLTCLVDNGVQFSGIYVWGAAL